MSRQLIETYRVHEQTIKNKLDEFRKLPDNLFFREFQFCLLTPQSNAHRCWEAVQEISKLKSPKIDELRNILRTRTRFHNNKAKYLMEAFKTWPKISAQLNNEDRVLLRNNLAKEVKGYGMKEAGHFLRNIGKSDNKIAILDRHILRNLKELGVISENDLRIRNSRHYHEIEEKFLGFSSKISIPIDHLDLLFWSNETGNVFK
ncbi:DNA lyase [Candidatus Pacearchaeota archaeon]|nr:DNA lyase [Candidatus Pacearchaeota archaeon]